MKPLVCVLTLLSLVLLANDFPNLRYYSVSRDDIDRFDSELPNYKFWQGPEVRDTDRQYWYLLEREEKSRRTLEENIQRTPVSISLLRWSDSEYTVLYLIKLRNK